MTNKAAEQDIWLTSCIGDDTDQYDYTEYVDEEFRVPLYKKTRRQDVIIVPPEKYLSLTQAIDFYEQYKIEYVRSELKSRLGKVNFIGPTQEDKYGEELLRGMNMCSSGKDMSRYGVRTTDFIYLLKDNRINLHGKKKDNTKITKIPEDVVTVICTIPNLEDKYQIYNGYEYGNSYNISTNYDCLKCIRTQEIKYTELSLEYGELNDWIKLYFADWWDIPEDYNAYNEQKLNHSEK